jgi:hypothetical protein
MICSVCRCASLLYLNSNMKKLTPLILACGLAVCAPVAVWAQSASATDVAMAGPQVRGVGSEVEMRAKVVAVDMAGRTASLKGPRGNLVTVNVPAEVRNFDQVRVGDELMVRYTTAVAAKLERVGKSGIRERVETSEALRAEQGDKPGVAVGRTVEILAEIQSLDKKRNQVVLRGAERTVAMVVPPSVDITALKVGDEVRALFLEAAVVTVDRK